MLNSAWVTESWSSRARWARSSRAASSPAWRRRSVSRRSRSRRSRTVPWAPANWPSRWKATPDTSAEIVEPSRWRSRRRTRTRSSRPWTSERPGVGRFLVRRGVDDFHVRAADDRTGRPAEEGGGALAPEREVAVLVGLPDAVGRGLDEVAEACLGLAQLGFQARPLAGIARRPVQSGDDAIDGAGHRPDVVRDAPAVVMDEIDPGGDRLARVRQGFRPAVDRLGDRSLVDQAREVVADHRAGLPAEQALERVAQVRESAVRVAREDDVRRILDEEAVALLRAAQLPLEPVALAHVADRAVRAHEHAADDPAHGDELGRDRVAVAVEQVDPSPDLVVAVHQPVDPVDLGDLARARVDEAAEVAAEELLRLPAGQALAGVGQEREPAVLVDRPDEVRRVLDEVPVARLGLAQERVEAGVADGDRRLVAEDLEEAERLVVDLMHGPERDGQRAHDLAGRRPQRDRRPGRGCPAAPRRTGPRARGGSAGPRDSRRSGSAGRARRPGR